jgi:hypothetical protein
MIDPELLARVRALIASGELPPSPPEMPRASDPAEPVAVQILIGGNDGSTCLICRAPRPALSYRYPGGRSIDVHWSPCDSTWRAEAERRRLHRAG